MEKIVYHGSPNGNIEVMKANVSTHQKECIYATDNLVIAMLFMARGNGDLDTVLSYDNGLPVLVERRPNVLSELYNKPGYIYELDGTTFNHYDYLWTPEMISFEKEIVPIRKTYYENILEELTKEESKGNIKIYRYPNRPNDIPLDNSDLIDKFIGFYNKGMRGAIHRLLAIYPEFTEIVASKMEGKKNVNNYHNKKFDKYN